MDVKKSLISVSTIILSLLGTASLNSECVKAQTLNIVKPNYGKTFMPYTKIKNKFDYAKKSLPVKKYKYYTPVEYENNKVVYNSYQDPCYIKGKSFLNLGDGGYIKANNAYTNNKGIVITKNSYVYDKSGNRLKTFRGKKAYFAKGSIIKSTLKSKSYNAPISYYNIGNGNYVSSTDISTLNGKGTLFVSQNSYVYDKSGKRANKIVIKAGSLINYAGKAEDGKNAAFYYLTNNAKKARHITNYKIGKNYFFAIGKNKFIKANNINLINGQTLLTIKPITIEITQDTYAYNSTLKQTDKLYRQGQKIKVDCAIQDGIGDDMVIYYRVAGTSKNPFYIQSGMGPDYGWGVYAWWEEGAATLAKQTLETTSYRD